MTNYKELLDKVLQDAGVGPWMVDTVGGTVRREEWASRFVSSVLLSAAANQENLNDLLEHLQELKENGRKSVKIEEVQVFFE